MLGVMRFVHPSPLRPMRLLRIPEPFDHPDFLYEVKFDGFRALAHINGHHCQLVSRNGHVYKSWPYLAAEIAHAVRAHSAILDGEIACLAPDGSSRFYDLLFRREWPYFLAFDVLFIDGEDLRGLTLVQRKRRLARIMPRIESRLMLLKPIPARGKRLFELACEHDLGGIVAKWSNGSYQSDGRGTSWLKIKNPEYSQAEGRHELFESRRRTLVPSRRVKSAAPALALR
jgi:bifunctional non-homologous end joining protein LigD